MGSGNRNKWVAAALAVAVMGQSGVAAALWKQTVPPWFKFKVGETHSADRATQAPTVAIKDLDKKLGDYRTGDNLTLAEKEHNKQIKNDILNTIFDVHELSRMALGKHWNQRSTTEQDDFVKLMTDLLMERGVLSKEQGKKKAKSDSVYNVSYRGDKYLDPKKSRALTKTSVRIKGENLNVGLDYKLMLEGNQWKIYDVIVDGASLMENYRFQFDSIIGKHGYADLVGRMQRKLDTFKSEGSNS